MTTIDFRITRGFAFSRDANGAESIAMLGADGSSIVFPCVDGNIELTSEQTTGLLPGLYQYQTLSQQGVVKQGRLFVCRNFLLQDGNESYWQKALKAVDDRIQGKAVDGAYRVKVGDKEIAMLSLSELFKMRDWILGKIAEEEVEETGDDSGSGGPDDGEVINLWWRNA